MEFWACLPLQLVSFYSLLIIYIPNNFLQVECAFTLIQNDITVQAIRQSKVRQKELVFKQGPSDVKGETNFREKIWGSQTWDYVYLAKEVLHDKSQNCILHSEKHYLKDMIPHHDEDELDTANSQAEPLGCCAMLVDLV